MAAPEEASALYERARKNETIRAMVGMLTPEQLKAAQVVGALMAHLAEERQMLEDFFNQQGDTNNEGSMYRLPGFPPIEGVKIDVNEAL